MSKPLYSRLYRAENVAPSPAENANASLPFQTAENAAVAAVTVENAAVCCCYAAVAAVVAAVAAVTC